MPPEQAAQAHEGAEAGWQHREPEQPALLGQCGDREQGDCDGQHGVGKVELVVLEVQVVVGFVVLLGLGFEFILLALLVRRQLGVAFDGFVVGGLFVCRAAGLGELELHDRRVGDFFADIAGLVEGPVVDLVGLRLLHGLVDIVVLDLADAHEGGEDGHHHGHAHAEGIAVVFVVHDSVLRDEMDAHCSLRVEH